MFRVKQLTIEQIIILLFSILPVVDSLNGILISVGVSGLGTIYKLVTLGILFLFALRNGTLTKGTFLYTLLAVIYLLFSIFSNMYILSGKLINADYPIKLLFNILTFSMLITCWNAGYISGESIYRILNINTWLMIFAVLVPYALNMGSTIYASGVGYKAFFYSNNELSASLIVLFYFSLYRITQKITLPRIGQLLGIAICVLLLNTKSGIIACFAGCGLYIVEYMFRKEARFKGLVFIAVCFGLYVAKDFIIAQVQNFMSRQTFLYELYGGSMLDTLLSGRTFFLKEAWNYLVNGPSHSFRLLFGNGFCSTHLVEMDFIDIFFYLGAIGVAMVTLFIFVILFRSRKNFKADHSIMRPFGYLMVVGFAFLAGHVIFMATAGCYFILICCFNLFYSQEPYNTLQRRTEQA